MQKRSEDEGHHEAIKEQLVKLIVKFELQLDILNPDAVHRSPLFGHMFVICLSYEYLYHIFGRFVISLS